MAECLGGKKVHGIYMRFIDKYLIQYFPRQKRKTCEQNW